MIGLPGTEHVRKPVLLGWRFSTASTLTLSFRISRRGLVRQGAVFGAVITGHMEHRRYGHHFLPVHELQLQRRKGRTTTLTARWSLWPIPDVEKCSKISATSYPSLNLAQNLPKVSGGAARAVPGRHPQGGQTRLRRGYRAIRRSAAAVKEKGAPDADPGAGGRGPSSSADGPLPCGAGDQSHKPLIASGAGSHQRGAPSATW